MSTEILVVTLPALRPLLKAIRGRAKSTSRRKTGDDGQVVIQNGDAVCMGEASESTHGSEMTGGQGIVNCVDSDTNGRRTFDSGVYVRPTDGGKKEFPVNV